MHRHLLVAAAICAVALPRAAAAPPAAGAEGIVRVTDFGADPTGQADSTAAFRAAIAAVRSCSRGATVIVPPGSYRISGTIELERCLLLGLAAGGWPADAGPMPELEVYEPFGPVIVARGGASIHGLSINFHHRAGDGPTKFPPAILLAGNGISITNVRIHAAYDGIIADGKSNIGRLNIENVFMPQLFHCGLYVTRTYDVATVRNVEVWVPHQWNIRNGGIGFRFGRNDCVRIVHCFAFKCAYGFVFDVDEGEGGGATWGEMSTCGTDACAEGIRVEGPVTLNIRGGTYWNHFTSLRVDDSRADVAVTGAMFQSNGAPALVVRDCRRLTVSGCQFRRAFDNPKVFLAEILGGGRVSITGCLFSNQSPSLRIGDGAGQVLVAGNVFGWSRGDAVVAPRRPWVKLWGNWFAN